MTLFELKYLIKSTVKSSGSEISDVAIDRIVDALEKHETISVKDGRVNTLSRDKYRKMASKVNMYRSQIRNLQKAVIHWQNVCSLTLMRSAKYWEDSQGYRQEREAALEELKKLKTKSIFPWWRKK